MLKEKCDYSAAAGWRDLIWVRVNYWDAEGSMAKSEVLLLTQWRLLAAFRKSWLFKLWRLQGNIRRAWLNLCAHEVSLICSRINLVKKILRMESVNLNSFQVWRSPVPGNLLLFSEVAEKNNGIVIWCEYVVKFLANLPAVYDSWEGSISKSWDGGGGGDRK